MTPIKIRIGEEFLQHYDGRVCKINAITQDILTDVDGHLMGKCTELLGMDPFQVETSATIAMLKMRDGSTRSAKSRTLLVAVLVNVRIFQTFVS